VLVTRIHNGEFQNSKNMITVRKLLNKNLLIQTVFTSAKEDLERNTAWIKCITEFAQMARKRFLVVTYRIPFIFIDIDNQKISSTIYHYRIRFFTSDRKLQKYSGFAKNTLRKKTRESNYWNYIYWNNESPDFRRNSKKNTIKERTNITFRNIVSCNTLIITNINIYGSRARIPLFTNVTPIPII
jgi:hypothetical protein